MPTIAIGRAALRNLGQPIPIPPSNRMKISATVTSRSTVVLGRGVQVGNTCSATAEAASTSAGAGTRSHWVSRLASTAASTTAAVTTSSSAKV